MKKLLAPAAVALFALPAPLLAQTAMPGMDMPDKPAPDDTKKGEDKADPHAGHNMTSAPSDQASTTQGPPSSAHDMSAMPGMANMPAADSEIGNAPAPAPPTDHAADAVFDPAIMAESREALRKENGAIQSHMILIDLAEYQARKGRDGYRWEGEAWFGGDINRLLLKAEGESNVGEKVGDAELQALYSRAITPFWNAHVGVRYDIAPNPSRTYAVIGVEGITPYWFHLTGQMFLSDKGDVRARLEGSYDERITQKLILQPRAEINLAAQDMRAIGVGSGLSTLEVGARLRYEFKKEFAPYIGVEWSKKSGDTARYARLAGEDPNVVNFVAGIRFWF